MLLKLANQAIIYLQQWTSFRGYRMYLLLLLNWPFNIHSWLNSILNYLIYLLNLEKYSLNCPLLWVNVSLPASGSVTFVVLKISVSKFRLPLLLSCTGDTLLLEDCVFCGSAGPRQKELFHIFTKKQKVDGKWGSKTYNFNINTMISSCVTVMLQDVDYRVRQVTSNFIYKNTDYWR